MSETMNRDELIELRNKLDAMISAAPGGNPETAPAPEPKRIPDTYVMVDGKPMPAVLQPQQSALQGAFRRAPGAEQRIVIDMAAALPIAQDLVRQARVQAFAKNDSEFMRAVQAGSEEAREVAVATGERLRNAPADQRLTDAKTPDDLLKAVEDIIAEF